MKCIYTIYVEAFRPSSQYFELLGSLFTRCMQYLLLLFFLFYNSFANCDTLQSSLEKIPSRDLVEIENLFRYLMLEEQFGYTLLGDKPISTIGVFKKKVIQSILAPKEYDMLLYRWNIWKKYASYFHSSNYSIIENESDHILEIYFINRNACKKIICENFTIFQNVLGREITPEVILKRIETSQQLVKEALNNSQLLYGILLGYGNSNAFGFEFMHKHRNYIMKPPKPFHEESLSLPVLIHLPYFMVFYNNAETAKLRETYRKERQEICAILNSSDNFLTILKKYLD
ncbi:MAG: hypothetical protein CK425_08295 [Parachlamydia sp.]|nr:MAG: hypothetical protein CK425_08295 [Parachlamydia sp.]